jgi:hypothetical protein
VYAFFVELFIHRSMKLSQVKQITVSSAVTSATLLIIVAGATCFRPAADPGGHPRPDHRSGAVGHSIAGCLSAGHEHAAAGGGHVHGHHFGHHDPGAGVSAHARCLQHQLDALRPDHDRQPGHRVLHPPMGVSLYITGAIANRDLIFVSKAVVPFIAIQLTVLFLMTYLPELVLWLPKLMGFVH